MKEILDKTESDDEWKNACMGRGGIPNDRCNLFTPDASVSLSNQEGLEKYISLDDVKSSESNVEMQVDNTTPATITSEVTCCAAGDLCTAPMGTKISQTPLKKKSGQKNWKKSETRIKAMMTLP